MIILGLGSNIGDRLANLRLALQRINQLENLHVVHVSPVYISEALLPDDAPADWNIPYLNAAISCETSLEPLALLKELKNIEHTIGRKPERRHWGPRIIDIDILAWEDRVIESDILTVPHINLQDRPFALWPLADISPEWIFPFPGKNQHKTAAEIVEQWGSRFTGEAPFHTKQLYQRIDTPRLMGILNITPDSFSDGGVYLNPEKAFEQAQHLITSGAEIIDIGAESTRPHATLITPEMEWQRLEPIFAAVTAAKNLFLLPPKISIDTRHAETAKKALDLGIDWINDQSGGDDMAMQNVIANSQVDYAIMHNLGLPASKEKLLPRDKNPMTAVISWAINQIEKFEKMGIQRERIILDPGIGFGKSPDQSLQILQQLDRLKDLGTRILIGHSRKSFLTLFTANQAAERDVETAVLSVVLAKQPVDYLRVHNVEMTARALKVTRAF